MPLRSSNVKGFVSGKILLIIAIIAIITIGYVSFKNSNSSQPEQSNPKQALKLYWFIPDGLRADPNLFKLYQWAKEGKLPNIKKMIENGSYGYAFPNFPSHTPTNFATLLTGAYPEVHGVDDGQMRTIGKPLNAVAIGGFRSVAKKVPPIWKTLEDNGLKVSILAVPGSTPPEISEGQIYRGRWGNWGNEIFSLNFETKGDLTQKVKQGRASRLFFLGTQLTQYIDGQKPQEWENAPKSYSDPLEVTMLGWGTKVYGYIYDSTNDNKKNYNKTAFSVDKKIIFADLATGQWSNWQPITVKWKTADTETEVASNVKVAIIKLDDNGFFRIRLEYDGLNNTITYPASIANELESKIGPMVDYADNYPPQLIYYPEDKQIFLDEAEMSYEWHAKAVSAINQIGQPNVIIHDIYTPNQMLTSRWWMGYIDPNSARYKNVSESERAKLWQEVLNMYKKIDGIVGEILKTADKNTYVVLSSDHGAVPLDKKVNLNNLFAQKGWLKFEIDPQTGEPIIDWENSTVIFLKMASIFINPNGLDGNYERASGPAYEKLRKEVEDALTALQDANGKKPLAQVVEWENVKKILKLDPDRMGDLVIANNPGYGWNEEMSNDLEIFIEPLETGYKQAIKSETVPGMWAPFVIMGPGIKKNNFMGEKPFELTDEYPTIMQALGLKSPSFVQGKVLPVFK